jgi:hypothetical protein
MIVVSVTSVAAANICKQQLKEAARRRRSHRSKCGHGPWPFVFRCRWCLSGLGGAAGIKARANLI